ncbi:hypothetical protein [Streptomyces roseicoloratus]|uniref:hypothetical protein n=1 Tax=Streptomyces roseicoloratus TaxID=2508722 RepID=UPI001009D41C|nr:hypothetical protein [Streptomyces roseicoloratus]
MSRTAHHRPPAHCHAADGSRPGAPWHAHVLYDVRHDAHGGVRKIRRVVAVYTFARHHRDRSVGRGARVEWRRARCRTRVALATAVRLANTAPGAVDTIDILPTRHRRSEIWLA